jgi:hypothetical protein
MKKLILAGLLLLGSVVMANATTYSEVGDAGQLLTSAQVTTGLGT